MLADYDARTPGRRACDPLKLGISEAYAVQTEIARLREERGERIIGYKVGCTSRLIQTQLGVSDPIFGRLFAEECHPSGSRLSAACFANLAVEGEMAVRLRAGLSGPSVTEEDGRARGARRSWATVSSEKFSADCSNTGWPRSDP